MADRIFGGRYVDIRPAGALTLKLGGNLILLDEPTSVLEQADIDILFARVRASR